MTTSASATPSAARRQALWLFGLALALRLLVVAFAARRFPPADDGSFYHVVATRIAAGAGYTWAWPDGAVTYAAHYPVGYPALLAAVYWLLGASPWCGMLLNAVLGALLVVAVHSCALHVTSLPRARLAALVVMLHPTLLLYTAALMTEAAAAAVVVLLAALTLRLSQGAVGVAGRLVLGVGGGALVLIRPQLLPLLPVLGALAVCVPAEQSVRTAFGRRLVGAAVTTALAVACCLPWTLRNCARMDGCVFVSANGGWNLLIGTLPEGKGSFAPITGDNVPVDCREVFGEAGKDRCFGRAGMRRIREAPVEWLLLAPRKLGQLFDHGAVASSYLSASNPSLAGGSVKLAIGAVETVCSRLLLLGAAFGLLRAAGSRSQRALALGAGALALSPWGFLAQICVLLALLAGWSRPQRAGGDARSLRALLALAATVLALCLVTHMVFFGAPRYALVWLPWLACLMVLPRSAGSDRRPALVF